MRTIDPGEFSKLIEIYRLAPGAKDADGFDTGAVEQMVWRGHARLHDESGTTAAANGTEFSEARRCFTIRHTRADITTDCFVRYRGKDYKIIRPVGTWGDSGQYAEIWVERKEMV